MGDDVSDERAVGAGDGGEPVPPHLPAGVRLSDPQWWDVPGPGVEAALMAEIDAVRPLGTAPIRRDRRRRRLAVAAAAVVVVAGGLLAVGYRWGDAHHGQPERAGGAEVALAPSGLQPGAAAVAWLDATSIGTYIRLDVTALAPAADDEYYEVWMADADAAVSAGTFHMRGAPNGSVVLWSGVTPDAFPRFEITLQRVGERDPSDRVVLSGVFAG